MDATQILTLNSSNAEVLFTGTPATKSVAKSAFHHSRNARIRPFLSTLAAERLIHSLITLRIDYYNSLYIGLPAKSIKWLQYIQNSAAHVLTHTSSCQHISGVLCNLHQLPFQSHSEFKMPILTYKAVHGMPPCYVCILLVYLLIKCIIIIIIEILETNFYYIY